VRLLERPRMMELRRLMMLRKVKTVLDSSQEKAIRLNRKMHS